jgi:hypothetical protein
MKKIFSLIITCALMTGVNGQIEISRPLGKESKDYTIGYGAFLNVGFALTEASDVTVEGGAIFFPLRESGFTQGILVCPIKLGYRYSIDGTGTGFYVEPQAGYCVAGAKSDDNVDEDIRGFVWSAGVGYMFPSSRRTNYNLGFRYESTRYKNGSVNFIALRFTSGLSFGRARF